MQGTHIFLPKFFLKPRQPFLLPLSTSCMAMTCSSQNSSSVSTMMVPFSSGESIPSTKLQSSLSQLSHWHLALVVKHCTAYDPQFSSFYPFPSANLPFFFESYNLMHSVIKAVSQQLLLLMLSHPIFAPAAAFPKPPLLLLSPLLLLLKVTSVQRWSSSDQSRCCCCYLLAVPTPFKDTCQRSKPNYFVLGHLVPFCKVHWWSYSIGSLTIPAAMPICRMMPLPPKSDDVSPLLLLEVTSIQRWSSSDLLCCCCSWPLLLL